MMAIRSTSSNQVVTVAEELPATDTKNSEPSKDDLSRPILGVPLERVRGVEPNGVCRGLYTTATLKDDGSVDLHVFVMTSSSGKEFDEDIVNIDGKFKNSLFISGLVILNDMFNGFYANSTTYQDMKIALLNKKIELVDARSVWDSDTTRLVPSFFRQGGIDISTLHGVIDRYIDLCDRIYNK
jgi:hypothetical protein